MTLKSGWSTSRILHELTYGGTIYIYDGADLKGEHLSDAAPTATIDLAGDTAALCRTKTGANPVRPHMLLFNMAHSHALLAFVTSGHVVIFDAATRAPVDCLRMSVGAGDARQAHAAFPAPDDTYILVANQNGKLLERLDVDYTTNTYTLNPAATLNLATCTTPNGVACQVDGVRPDTAPICPIIDASGRLGFITLRGGGLFVVDPTQTPMAIVAEYDMSTVHGNGCGGSEVRRHMYLNSDGGTATNLAEFDVYKFPLSGYSPANPPNTPAPRLLFSDDSAEADRDAHGMVATKHGRYLWVGDRHNSTVEVFSVASGRRVNTIDLTGPDSDDPSPDLMDIAPSGNRIFISLRGPNPLSGDPHASTGSTPGLMVVQVRQGGKAGVVQGIVRISHLDAGGVERADAHGIRVRRK